MIIIGGGVMGAGIVCDCVLCGLCVILVECYDIVTGVIGCNYGLLYSGVCYVVIDVELACECISEN